MIRYKYIQQINIKNSLYFFIIFNILYDITIANMIIYNDSLPLPTLIRKHGFKIETHKVITEDGYILSLHRIPNHGKPPVLLNHGIVGSSSVFVVMGPQHALAYELYKAGFDVWIGNYRGNFYSKEHVSLNNTQFEFWQFGVHEMGVYDLPAEIDHIINITKYLKINYIGFSLGTLYYWILMSEKPEYNDKINQMHALAPMAYWGNAENKINTRKIFLLNLMETLNTLKVGEVLRNIALYKRLSIVCNNPLLLKLCGVMYSMFYARRSQYVNENLVPLLLQHHPAGLSTRTIQHSIQLIDTGRFYKFDYGSMKENMKRYNSTEPPDYNLHKVTSPVFIQYALGDVIARPKNVEKLCDELPNCKEKRIVPDPKFAHDDFCWSTAAKSLVYNHIIKTMKCKSCGSS